MYCDILQYIATFIAFKVVSIRLLHHKFDWTSHIHEYSVEFLAILHVSTYVAFTAKNTRCQILQYGNILQYTQT